MKNLQDIKTEFLKEPIEKYLVILSFIIVALIPTPEIDKLAYSWDWVIQTYKFQISIAFPIFVVLYLISLLLKKIVK